jgi:hypothetical protein
MSRLPISGRRGRLRASPDSVVEPHRQFRHPTPKSLAIRNDMLSVTIEGRPEMKASVSGIALATLLLAASTISGHAEEPTAAPDAQPTATTPAAQPSEAPVSVPRPSIVPQTAEPAAPQTSLEPAPRKTRRYAHHHYRHSAYWEPFPIYMPNIYRNHIVWNRIRWFSF